jgi:hypothetical protein
MHNYEVEMINYVRGKNDSLVSWSHCVQISLLLHSEFVTSKFLILILFPE